MSSENSVDGSGVWDLNPWMQTTNEAAIRDALVKRGQDLFNATQKHVQFTKNAAADALLNDLAGHPHAFVLACLMDRQVKAEKAWLIPYHGWLMKSPRRGIPWR